MKQFNWDKFINFNNKIAVHCKTEKETKDFCKCMDDQGIVWITKYDKYCENTCYTGLGIYINYNSCEDYGYKILEWSDYMKKELTKADLKDGMVVEQKNGERYVIYNGKELSLYEWNPLEQFRDDLTNELENLFSIEKVYKLNTKEIYCLNDIFHDINLELIWERTETKHMTPEEMRQKLEELTGEKIKIEPSREEMIGTIKIHCNDKPCETCILNNKCLATNIYDMSKEQLKQCYKEVMEDGRKES